MENASKALIIAGAILLSILIISLGIMIYNQAAGVVNNNAMSEVDISSFNQKFTQYDGDHVRGAQVSALIDQVRNNNITYQDDTSRQVAVTLDSAEVDVNDAPNIPTGKTYSVDCVPDANSGLINTINIKTNS